MSKRVKAIVIFLALLMTVLTLTGCVVENEDITVKVPEGYPGTELIVSGVLRSNVIIESTIDTLHGRVKSRGSGVILSSEGYILTNKHVISGDKKVESMKKAEITVQVMLENHAMVQYKARYIPEQNSDAYADIDLAILKIKSLSPLLPVTLGAVDSIKYGTAAIVIGNPKGLGIMVADALVSSPGVLIRTDDDDETAFTYVAINSDINSGNSGGGLYNYAGELIGLVTLREIDDTQDNANVVLGIGYALRIDEIRMYLRNYPAVNLTRGT